MVFLYCVSVLCVRSNVHSGIRELYIPYDGRAAVSESARNMRPLMDLINARHCHCNSGSGGEIGGYLAYGTRYLTYSRLLLIVWLSFEV